MSADATEALWQALTSKDTQKLVEGLRTAPALQSPAPRMRVVVVKNDLDECFYCGAEDRNGDFDTQVINGEPRANCETCAPLRR